jgi:hypothetical protein
VRHRYYSPFWLAGGILTSPEWAERDRDDPVHEAESMPLEVWLRLGEPERAAVVQQYARRTPRASRLPSRV